MRRGSAVGVVENNESSIEDHSRSFNFKDAFENSWNETDSCFNSEQGNEYKLPCHLRYNQKKSSLANNANANASNEDEDDLTRAD